MESNRATPEGELHEADCRVRKTARNGGSVLLSLFLLIFRERKAKLTFGSIATVCAFDREILRATKGCKTTFHTMFMARILFISPFFSSCRVAKQKRTTHSALEETARPQHVYMTIASLT